MENQNQPFSQQPVHPVQPTQFQSPTPPPNIPTPPVHYIPSSFVKRFWAMVIDGILIAILSFLLSYTVLKSIIVSSRYDTYIFQAIIGVIGLVYNVLLLQFLNGATIGKKILRIKVVNTQYQKLSFWQIILREIPGKFLSSYFIFLGYIWVAFDEKRQAWHDKLAKTYVINLEPVSQEHIAMQQPRKVSHAHTFFIIFGSIEVIFASIFGFSVIPSLSELYKKMNLVTYTPVMMYLGIIILSILALIQIAIGVYLYVKKKKSRDIEDFAKKSFRFLFVPSTVFFTLIFPFLTVSILWPVYKLTTTWIDGSPTPTPTTVSPTPTPIDETANWKTYTNTKFNYSVKLQSNYTPLDAEFNPIDDPANEYYISFLRYSSDLAKQYKNQEREKAYYDSFTVLIQGNDPCSSTDPAGTVKKEKIFVGGIEGTKWVGNSPTFADPSYGDIVIRVLKNSRCYEIYFLRDPNNLKQSENILDQILQSFKFFDETNTISETLSSEGQSCGRNAGPAGDARCKPGLICRFANQQEEQVGIGTCVKQ